jgi:nicotinamidase-related amidase
MDVSHDLDYLMRELIAEPPPSRPLNPRRTALLIIDMQYLDASREYGLGRIARERGKAHLYEPRFARIDEIVPRIAELAAECRRHGVTVIHLRVASTLPRAADAPPGLRGMECVEGSKEAEFLEELAPQPGDVVISKTSVSAFTSTNIDWQLRNLGIETLIATGIVTSGCVELTMRDAADRGYRGVVVEDGCGANSPELHRAAIERLSHGQLRAAPAAEVIRELAAVR